MIIEGRTCAARRCSESTGKLPARRQSYPDTARTLYSGSFTDPQLPAPPSNGRGCCLGSRSSSTDREKSRLTAGLRIDTSGLVVLRAVMNINLSSRQPRVATGGSSGRCWLSSTQSRTNRSKLRAEVLLLAPVGPREGPVDANGPTPAMSEVGSPACCPLGDRAHAQQFDRARSLCHSAALGRALRGCLADA